MKACAALLMCKALLLLQLNPTSAGDSAPYPRRASSQDDVVIVSALRTPVCKVLSTTYSCVCVLCRLKHTQFQVELWKDGLSCCTHGAMPGAWDVPAGATLEASSAGQAWWPEGHPG